MDEVDIKTGGLVKAYSEEKRNAQMSMARKGGGKPLAYITDKGV